MRHESHPVAACELSPKLFTSGAVNTKRNQSLVFMSQRKGAVHAIDLATVPCSINHRKNAILSGQGVGMGWLRGVAGGLLAGSVGACAAVDSTIEPRYDTFNRQLERARNEAILLNIVRAEHDWPLAFSTISQLSPTFQNTTTLGVPQFLLGPNQRCSPFPSVPCISPPPTPGRDVIFGGQNQATNATTITTGFTVAPNEDRNFYDALLRPVDLHILSYFIRQGYSRELLFWLFSDSVEVGPPSHAIGFQYNPPYEFG